MVSYRLTKFDSHRYCGSGNVLVVEGKDST